MTLLFLILSAILVRMPFLLQSGNLMDFDEATFALMAKRILEGEIPFYISGHSYSGSMISFVMAPFVATLGTTPLAIKLASLSMFLVFIILNYFLLKKIFSKPVSVFANVLLVCMPSGVLDISLRVWGGHAELWSFSAGLLLLLVHYFDSSHSKQVKNKLLIAIGLVAGAALWINDFFLLFLLPYIIYFALRSRQDQNRNLLQSTCDWITLKQFHIPKWLRYFFLGLHAFIGLTLLMHVFSMILPKPTPEWIANIIDVFRASTPFRVKEIKKIALVLLAEALILAVASRSTSDARKKAINRISHVAGGFLIGYLPALLFNILGGEGLRIFQKSGFLNLPALQARFSDIFANKIPNFVLGLSYHWRPAASDIMQLGGTFFLGLIITITLFVLWHYRRDFLLLWKSEHRIAPSHVVIFFLIGIMTIAGNLLSTLEAVRYLAPLYIALTTIIGVFLGGILWPKSRIIASFVGILIAGHFLYTNAHAYLELPKTRMSSYEQMLDYLEANNIQGGHAARTVSHILTYLSNEEIVFSTYAQKERYLPHETYTNLLSTKAYAFENDDSSAELFRKNAELKRKVKHEKIFGNYVIFIVEAPLHESTTPDSYLTWREAPHLHVYLNE